MDTYNGVVAMFVRMLGNLDTILTKIEAEAAEKGIDTAQLLQARLAPDMLPLVKQVQIACDNAKGHTARFAGEEPPAHEDNETTVAQLHERIAKTIAYIQTVDKEKIAQAADRKMEMRYFPGKHIVGSDFVFMYAVPNFLFHVTTAYDILRNQGFTLGKNDFMSGDTLPWKENE